MTFAIGRYTNQLRGMNLNAPVDGVRPDPNFANVIVVVSDASMRHHRSRAGGRASTSPAASATPTRRAGIRSVPMCASTIAIAAPRTTPTARSACRRPGRWTISGRRLERSPATACARSVSTQALRNLNAQVSWDANSGAPYTITTGTDDNGDSIFNDRPVLTPRNSVRLPWRSTLSANVSYTIPIGSPPRRRGRPRRRRGGPRGGGPGRRPSEGHHASACRSTTSPTARTTPDSAA